MYVACTLEAFLTKAAQQFPVMLLTGARQVGKTTLLRHLSETTRSYVTLDDPLVLNLARTDPALFMQRFPSPVLIDEIQYAPRLLPYIKMAADRAQRGPGPWSVLQLLRADLSPARCARSGAGRRQSGGGPMRTLIKTVLLLPVILIGYHTLVRIIRRYYKFPIPEFLANAIDNPLRRRFQPPDETAIRHGLEPGRTALEVGPGNGRYSVAAARRIGPTGRLCAVDIEPKMIERVPKRIGDERCPTVGSFGLLVAILLPPHEARLTGRCSVARAIYGRAGVRYEMPRPLGDHFRRGLPRGYTLALAVLLPTPWFM